MAPPSVSYADKAPAGSYANKPITTDELACTYAALILADDDVPITGEKISTLLQAADVTIEPIWPNLFAKALQGVNVRQLVSQSVAAGGAAPIGGATATPGAAGAPPVEEKEEPKKEESEDESDEDMGLGLFD